MTNTKKKGYGPIDALTELADVRVVIASHPTEVGRDCVDNIDGTMKLITAELLKDLEDQQKKHAENDS